MAGTKRILIAGGGIGGLTAALALRRAGHEVQVFERAPELKPVGAGIVLAINALLALKRVGVHEQVMQAGLPVQTVALLDSDGTPISESNLGALAHELGVSAVAYHRADLHDVLLELAGRDVVRLGAQVTSFEQDAGEVRVRLADGTEAAGDGLIGADGLHSEVRRGVVGETPLRYAGYTSWRAVTAPGAFSPPGRTTETWGPGRRFGIVPLKDQRVYWFAVQDAPAGGRDPESGAKALVRSLFRGWPEPIGEVIDATADDAILRTDIHDRDPVRTWTTGRVALLGDAAHPMTPNMGQGACQAVEDAIVLADELSKGGDVPEALKRYEQRRLARTRTVVLQSRRFGALAQWKNPAARWLRNTVMRATPERVVTKQLRGFLLGSGIE